MISQDDIDAFEQYNGEDKKELTFDRINKKAANLAYEFHPDYLYDLLVFAVRFGSSLTDAQIMKIAYEARKVWEEEHN